MKLKDIIKKELSKKSANITYGFIVNLYNKWYRVYKEYQIAEKEGYSEEMERLYYQMVDYAEYIWEERCYMADALTMIPENELNWLDLYWKKMNKFDKIMDYCENADHSS